MGSPANAITSADRRPVRVSRERVSHSTSTSAEDTPGLELCQHLLPLLVAPPDAQLVAGAADRLSPVHAEQTQQAFVHVDPVGVGQPSRSPLARVRLEGAAELRFGDAQCLVRRPPGGDIRTNALEQPCRPDRTGATASSTGNSLPSRRSAVSSMRWLRMGPSPVRGSAQPAA